MPSSLPNSLSCVWALLGANARAQMADGKKIAVMSGFMFVQNMLFFALWIVFFKAIRDVKGWHIEDVAIMFGIMASAVGISLFVADGARMFALRIMDGSIDAFLTRPRHPLPALLTSRSSPASLGDILFGPFLWFALGGAVVSDVPFLVLLTLLSTLIFSATTIIFYALAFWVGKNSRFSDQLFETMLIMTAVPQNGQSLGIKIVLFSALPAGFIALLPVSLFRAFDPWLFAALVGGVALYIFIAIRVFNAGVKKYVAGT